MANETITVHLDETIKHEFIIVCNNNFQDVSKRIRLIICKDIESDKEINKDKWEKRKNKKQ